MNFSQLKEIKEQVAASIFVKQDTATKHITIGKDIDGDKVDIVNKSDNLRIISGVKKAERDNDAINKK
ncbi:hypothetical protein [Bartonella grahamii]|uniref:hypothetical protein n=1 Tax=Bartonella grahamii TaxID=33045 RepID=UPI002E7C24DC|nr:hypothetical protein [Bartonella grahamii]